MSEMLFRAQPLGMNLRNRIIRDFNTLEALHLAKDKSAFKKLLVANGVATPKTYHEIHDLSDTRLVKEFPAQFVVKPAKGYGGSGIMLLQREGNYFRDPVGRRYRESELRLHIRKILDGDFSGYIDSDTVIIEERIYPSPKLQFRDSLGLPDVRVFCHEFEPVMAMLRYPTFKSRGRSNLSTGAIGMGIDLSTGRITYVHSKKHSAEFKPDYFRIPEGFRLPNWDDIKEVSRICSRLAGLRFSGVDVVLNRLDEVMVLEINGRPGLEIQNVNEDSLLRRIRLSFPADES